MPERAHRSTGPRGTPERRHSRPDPALWQGPLVLSHVQVTPLVSAHHRGDSIALLSCDLGLSTAKVRLDIDGVRLPGGVLLRWPDVEEIAASDSRCFVLEEGSPRPAQIFSAETNRLRSLYPTAGAPTVLVAGVLMHRIKDIDPWEDTRRKLHAVMPVRGRVLDTATGLGYTALMAAVTADQVVTIDNDPTALVVAALNPWSAGLFGHPRIETRTADSFEEIGNFPAAAFDRILHDPPAFAHAGELYSGAFYQQLRRVLAPRGLLFHYLGDLSSPAISRILPGVIRRLHEAGFEQVSKRPDTFGVVAR